MSDLKAFRKERKMTQKALGDRLGYTHAYISNIEHGKERMSDNFIEKFKEEFGILLDNNRGTVEEPVSEYVTEWKLKYETLDREHKELMKKYISCLENAQVRPSAETGEGKAS